jgi:hypothetical protein
MLFQTIGVHAEVHEERAHAAAIRHMNCSTKPKQTRVSLFKKSCSAILKSHQSESLQDAAAVVKPPCADSWWRVLEVLSAARLRISKKFGQAKVNSAVIIVTAVTRCHQDGSQQQLKAFAPFHRCRSCQCPHLMPRERVCVTRGDPAASCSDAMLGARWQTSCTQATSPSACASHTGERSTQNFETDSPSSPTEL